MKLTKALILAITVCAMLFAVVYAQSSAVVVPYHKYGVPCPADGGAIPQDRTYCDLYVTGDTNLTVDPADAGTLPPFTGYDHEVWLKLREVDAGDTIQLSDDGTVIYTLTVGAKTPPTPATPTPLPTPTATPIVPVATVNYPGLYETWLSDQGYTDSEARLDEWWGLVDAADAAYDAAIANGVINVCYWPWSRPTECVLHWPNE